MTAKAVSPRPRRCSRGSSPSRASATPPTCRSSTSSRTICGSHGLEGAPRAERGRRQGGDPRHDRSPGRWRRRAVRPYRRRAGRGAAMVEPAVQVTRGGRSALWPRRLRHEGLRRLRAGDGARVPGRRAQAAGSHRAELRRGDHLPRLPRHHRPVRQGRAASGCGDRRRTDDDGGRGRAQERRNLPDAGHRP